MKTELSPITGKPMKLVMEPDVADVRGEEIPYTHVAFRCEDTGEQFTTTELDEVNVNQIYNTYRHRHSYPFPQEIAQLREYYGVSAATMSEIMGFGANQWRYYEAEKLPSESNARAICAIRNKSVFLDFLDASRFKIGDKAYDRIKKRVSELPPYRRPSTPDLFNGFFSRSDYKTAEVLKYFISKLGPVFVTKMNKLMFYADFLTYKSKGVGLTGLEYRAITHGPVPVAYGEVYSNAQGIRMEEYIYPNGTSGILLFADQTPDISCFTEQELEILDNVWRYFESFSAGEISEESHKEEGWIKFHNERERIPYSYGFAIQSLEERR